MSKEPCSCIRDTFYLNVSSPNRGVLLIHDLSNWVTNEDNFVYPDFYFINIKNPKGEEKEYKVSPQYGHIISEELIDGVYEFTLDNCGVIYRQKQLITSDIECAIDLAIVKTKDKRDFDIIRDIKNDLLVAKGAAWIGNYESSKKILELIKIKLGNLSCDCKCKK